MRAILHASCAGLWVSALVSPMTLPERLQHQPTAEAAPAEGRSEAAGRDPFVRLTGEASDAAAAPPVSGPPAEGLQGLSMAEVALRGVLESHGHQFAFIEAPGKKHYVVRAGDRLRDGHVKAVTADGLVFVADGTSAEGARQVRRSLARGEDR